MSGPLRAALALLIVLAGCGGDGGGEPSRERFVADANRICREGEAAVSRRFDAERSTPDTLRAVADAYEPYLERLRALRPPPDLEGQWDAFLDDVEAGFALLPEIARAAQDEDADALQRIAERASDIANRTRPFAQRHGLEDCLAEREGR